MNGKRPIRLCALTTISKTMDWFVSDTMRDLSRNGYEITLICSMGEGFAERNRDYATCIDLPMRRGACLRDLITVPWKLYRIFRKNRFDLIYYSTPNASFYAALAGKLAGVPLRVYSQCGLRYVSFDGFKRAVFRKIERLTCRLSTTVRAQSKKNMDFAVSEKLCPAEKISVVGIGGTTGVDLAQCDALDRAACRERLRKEHQIPQNAFLFGYLGRINADKGINELIDAFVRLQKEDDSLYLMLVGMPDDLNPITPERMKIAQTHPNIRMTGNVPPEQVYPYMAAFDVLTHPTYREGFGKSLQEAMGMRLPILTTDVPGPSEAVQNGVSGLLIPAKNTDALANAMLRLRRDKDLRKSLAAAGRIRAERYFDRPIMLKNLRDDFDRITDGI